MPESVFGLPIHPLIVHATVVLVPLTALLVLGTALSPRLRAWAGPLPLLAAVVSVVLAPLSTSTGETLEDALGGSKAIDRHAELGEMLIWWCLGLLAVAAAQWFLRRGGRTVGQGLGIALLVAGLVVGIGTTVQVVLIGHSGAESAWSGVMSN